MFLLSEMTNGAEFSGNVTALDLHESLSELNEAELHLIENLVATQVVTLTEGAEGSEKEKGFLARAWDGVKKFLAKLKEYIMAAWNWVTGKFSALWSRIKSFFGFKGEVKVVAPEIGLLGKVKSTCEAAISKLTVKVNKSPEEMAKVDRSEIKEASDAVKAVNDAQKEANKSKKAILIKAAQYAAYAAAAVAVYKLGGKTLDLFKAFTKKSEMAQKAVGAIGKILSPLQKLSSKIISFIQNIGGQLRSLIGVPLAAVKFLGSLFSATKGKKKEESSQETTPSDSE